MKRIVFVRNASNNIGGVEGQMLRLAKDLYFKKIFEPIFITDNKDSPFSKKIVENGFKLHIFRDKNIIKSALFINTICKKYNSNLVQCHLFNESMLARISKFINPRIKHVFRAQTYIDCAHIPIWEKKIYHLIDKLTSNLVDLYIANGKYLSEEIIKRSYVNKNRVVTILNGVPRLGKVDNNKIKGEINHIAIISNIQPFKGFDDVVIPALSILKEKGHKIKVTIIGGELTGRHLNHKPYTEYLMGEAIKLGISNQLDFYGYTSNVRKALGNIPVVVLPSDSEGVPNSILEAMSIRKLVIATEVGGIPEIIKNGYNGFLHKRKDPYAFVEVLQKLNKMPYDAIEEIRNNAYKTWESNFSLDIMSDLIVKQYKKLKILN